MAIPDSPLKASHIRMYLSQTADKSPAERAAYLRAHAIVMRAQSRHMEASAAKRAAQMVERGEA